MAAIIIPAGVGFYSSGGLNFKIILHYSKVLLFEKEVVI